MKICICDNDEYILNELIKNISNSFLSSDTFSVRCFYNAKEMLEDESVYSFDVFFISTENDGVTAAEIIRRHKNKAIIILTSDSQEFIYEAFRLEALHYINKTSSSEDFSELFKRIIVKYRSTTSLLTLRWKNERYTLDISDIIYIEGYNRHLTFYTRDEEFSSVGKLQSIHERLAAHGFLRIHQGYLVNMNHIKHFCINEAIMSDGTKVMISTRRRTDALKIYDEFLEQKEIYIQK